MSWRALSITKLSDLYHAQRKQEQKVWGSGGPHEEARAKALETRRKIVEFLEDEAPIAAAETGADRAPDFDAEQWQEDWVAKELERLGISDDQ